MKEVTFETWHSSDAQREIHFFVKGTDQYVFGYQPRFIKTKNVRKFLKKCGYKVKGLRVREKPDDGKREIMFSQKNGKRICTIIKKNTP